MGQDDPGDGPPRPRTDAGAVVTGEEAQFAAKGDDMRQADLQEYLLMREYLSACLEPSTFVSVPFLNDGHQKALFAFVPGCESDCQDGGVGQGGGQRGTVQSHSKLPCRLTTRGLQ